MSDKKDLKIEAAPQEAILFNEVIIDLFIIKILGITSFFVSDESYVSDMRSYVASKGKQISENEWEFNQTMFDAPKAKEETGKDFWQLSREEKKKYKKVVSFKLHRKDVSFDEDIIAQVKDLFGAEITSKDLEGSFVNLGMVISKQVTPEKRIELALEHKKYT